MGIFHIFKILLNNFVECLSSLAIAMRHIRVQLEERQTLFRSPKRSKSQSDISSLNINQV